VRLSLHARLTLQATLLLLLAGFAALLASEWHNPRTLGGLEFGAKLWAAAFASVSARTAGFNSIDIGALNDESLLLHELLMFIGGGSAGTAGGIKVTTFGLLAFVLWSEMRGETQPPRRKAAHPTQQPAPGARGGAVERRRGGHRHVHAGVLTHHGLERALFEVVSAFATVGLSTGITGSLPPQADLLLVVLMFAGRIGPLTLASALALRERTRRFELPEERTIIG
jgi:trk system potassium uptake protein TrkH